MVLNTGFSTENVPSSVKMKKIQFKIYPNGAQFWYLNGEHHREDGPAIFYPDGSQDWLLNGELHREDGPAVIYPDGYRRWFLNGKFIKDNEDEKD